MANNTNDPEQKTKTVKFGSNLNYEIPAHMTKEGMIEIWHDEAETFEQLAVDIVENHRRFASEIVSEFCRELGYYLEPKASHDALYKAIYNQTEK